MRIGPKDIMPSTHFGLSVLIVFLALQNPHSLCSPQPIITSILILITWWRKIYIFQKIESTFLKHEQNKCRRII